MNASFEKYLAPVKAINELTVNNVEKVINHQVKAINENAKIGVDSLKAAANVTDLESWKAYVTAQIEVARNASEAAVSDAKAYAEMGQAYSNEVRGILENAVTAK
jgi:phasin family protein